MFCCVYDYRCSVDLPLPHPQHFLALYVLNVSSLDSVLVLYHLVFLLVCICHWLVECMHVCLYNFHIECVGPGSSNGPTVLGRLVLAMSAI